MAESESQSARTADNATPAPVPAVQPLTELRVAVNELPRVHEALARALGEAGVGGQELHSLFGAGVRAVCVGCGLSVTGTELGELTVSEEGIRDRPLSPKLDRLRLGACPRNGCQARYFNVEITSPGRFDRGLVLGRTRQFLSGRSGPLQSLRSLTPSVSPATRRATQRLAFIALATLFVAFVVYRLTFYRSQPIPFVQPKSPYTINPASIDPNHR